MTIEIHGFCEDRFSPLRDAFVGNFEAGRELGASLAVTCQGRMVVDLWGGWADPQRTIPWREDTLVNVASTTKTPLIISALMLVDRGLIDLDAPLARYWPEFGQGGKQAVTVRHAFTHQAGVPGLDPPARPEDVANWEATVRRLAAEPHWFGGEPRVMYHLMTYGFLLGELIRRVDGRGPARFFREEIQSRCGADFHMGLTSESDLGRVATVQDLAPPAPPSDDLVLRMVRSFPPRDLTPRERASREIPAAVGFGNGRSIARMCAIMALGGELDGVRYMSPAMVEEASREQVFGVCPYLGPLRLGLGFGLYSEFFPAVSPTAFHWGGYGGSWALMDTKTGVSLGYAPNNFVTDPEAVGPRQQAFSDALERILPDLAAAAGAE